MHVFAMLQYIEFLPHVEELLIGHDWTETLRGEVSRLLLRVIFLILSSSVLFKDRYCMRNPSRTKKQ